MAIGNLVEDRELRGRLRVFTDRADAGARLATLLSGFRGSDALVVAIPAGGVPVAIAIAEELRLPLDLAPVSKITLPWNTESGYGAVAFDGTVRLNRDVLAAVSLSAEEIERGVERTRRKVSRRARDLHIGLSDLEDRPVIVVDDGLASGFTMLVAIEALRNARAKELIVAVPTGHIDAIARISPAVEQVCCANVRSRHRFAVASAYEIWRDLSDDEVLKTIERFRQSTLN